MPAPVPVPFWTQHYEARSRTVTAERLVNWYLEKSPQNAKYPFALYPTPGLKILTTAGDGPVRGVHRLGNRLYAVSGDRIYSISSTFGIVDVGEIGGTGNVYMTADDTHVLVVTSNKTYAVNESGVLQVAESNMVGAAYQDGYALSVKRGTEQFHVSNLENLPEWSGSDFSSADALADAIVTLVSVRRQIMLLGGTSTEWWYNSGQADFPFERVPGGFAEIGCLAPGSAAILGNTAFWLGHDHQVYKAVGFEVPPISPSGITGLIENLNSPHTAWAFAYNQGGHTFYVLNFSDATIVYDLDTGLWHRRKSHGMGRWRANCHVSIWGRQIVGDSVNGNIYELDLDHFMEPRDETAAITSVADASGGITTVTSVGHGLSTDDNVTIVGSSGYDGTYIIDVVTADTFKIRKQYRSASTGTWWRNETVRREADSPPVHVRGDRAVMHELFVDMETGVGIDGSGQGSDPELMVSWSEDGGRTFGNEVSSKIGKIGEYDTQVRLFALGEFRQRTIRIAISDPVKAVVVGAWANVEPRPA